MSLQDPEFDQLKRAYSESRFNDALKSVNKLLAQHPQSFALRWHHARVLEKLERFSEARAALAKVLKLRSDFVPALIMQVQLYFHEHESDTDDVFEDDPEQKEQTRFDLIEKRLYKILSIDPNAVDALHMLSGLLRGHEGDVHVAKAKQLLDRAISLAPERIDLLEDRANSFLAQAFAINSENDYNSDDADIVTTFSGMRYSRSMLEQALADFQTCYALGHQHRYGLRVGSILHDLERFNDALVAYDSVLSRIPKDDPYRPFILERRERSENNGAGEREHMAQMLEAAVSHKGGKDRGLDEDNIAQAILSAANAVRSGKSVSDALDARVSDDPDENMATSIAAQILNVANESPPGLVAVDAKDFPSYQQKFAAQCKHKLSPLGLRHVCDAEAQGMRLMLGQRVLLSFFADASGETGVTCFAMKPKQPSLTALLFLLFTGKWKTVATVRKSTKMVECVSQFNNGDHLSTLYESPSPFEYSAPIFIEKLPANTSAAELVALHLQRVAEHKQENPGVVILRALNLAAMEQRWIKGQAVKRDYRTKIGYITEPELQKLLGAHYDKFAHKVRAKLKVLAADL